MNKHRNRLLFMMKWVPGLMLLTLPALGLLLRAALDDVLYNETIRKLKTARAAA